VLDLVPLPAFADNYIWLAADADGAAIAVDPGTAQPVREALADRGWRLQAILLTHHHDDHVGGVPELVAATGARVHAPHDPRIAQADQRHGDGALIAIDAPACRFEVLDVPGHTRSHLAYAGSGLLFCGDTLFGAGCGRLFEGSPGQMLASLDRLAALPPTTLICCAHEYTLGNCVFALTIEPHNSDLLARYAEVQRQRRLGQPTLPVPLGLERATNPFLRVDAPAVIDWAARHGIPAADRVARFAALRRAKDDFRMPPAG